MRHVRFSLFLVLAAAACSGGGGSTGPGSSNGSGSGTGSGGGANNDCPSGAVCFLASTYTPTSLIVSKGATVNFVNNSGISHTVNFDGTRPAGVADIPLNSSGTFARTFSETGHFGFHCTQHVGMTGEIVVN